jgi:hypothetical protein
MPAKLEAVIGYSSMENSFDLIGLIKTIKGLSLQFEGRKSKTRGLLLAPKRFQHLNQFRDTTNALFLEQVITSVSVL